MDRNVQHIDSTLNMHLFYAPDYRIEAVVSSYSRFGLGTTICFVTFG